MAIKPKRSWTEKLHNAKGLPKVVKIEGKMSKRWGTGTCAIPSPMEVNDLMAKVPKGKLITINDIRAAVAKKHKATIGCPITSGIFSWISAYAADEQLAQGKKKVTPYWRTLRTGGVVNEKYPGSLEFQKKFLEREGHQVTKKGKKYVVVDYEKKRAKI